MLRKNGLDDQSPPDSRICSWGQNTFLIIIVSTTTQNEYNDVIMDTSVFWIYLLTGFINIPENI